MGVEALSPSISVVIPVYNRSESVVRAITSVIRQSYPVREIIVVDDGSTDNTVDAVKAIGDPRIRVLSIGTNRGGSYARNVGIDEVKSEYVAFLDSDDWWNPEKIARQVDLVKKNEDRTNIIYYTNIIRIYKYVQYISNKNLYDGNSHLSDYLITNKYSMQTSSLLLYSAFARTIRFDERLPCFQDWDFVLRANTMQARFVGTMEALVNYDNTASFGRISQNISHKRVVYWLEVAKPDLTKKANSSLFLFFSFPYLLKKDTVQAFSGIIRAILCGVPLQRVLRTIVKVFIPRKYLETIKKSKLMTVFHADAVRRTNGSVDPIGLRRFAKTLRGFAFRRERA
jgi:glycosyltransferase involved in cell wall biosynthesis